MAEGEDLTKENRISVKLALEKKFNVTQWEYEIYNITLEGPVDALITMKDVARLLLPVAKNLKVVAIKAFKGETAELPPAQTETKKEEVVKKKTDDI